MNRREDRKQLFQIGEVAVMNGKDVTVLVLAKRYAIVTDGKFRIKVNKSGLKSKLDSVTENILNRLK